MTFDDMVVTRWGVRFMGRRFPASIGKGGIATRKVEGDGATPTGAHHIVGMLYRADRMSAPVDWAQPIGPTDGWSDDTKDPEYNQMISTPHPFSHERLRRSDRLYDLVLLTDWNWPDAVPGRGSAIFIHRWRKNRHPTEGCVGFRPDHLLWIAKRVSLGTRVIVR